MVFDLEDITSDETKHIWIKICHILLPEVKKFNSSFKENKDKREQYWLEVFMSGIEGANSIFSQFSKEIPNLYSRYWNSIILNREIINPHKNVLIEGSKFYSILNSFISTEKQPTILLDILLIFITWYSKDMMKDKRERQKKLEELKEHNSEDFTPNSGENDNIEGKLEALRKSTSSS